MKRFSPFFLFLILSCAQSDTQTTRCLADFAGCWKDIDQGDVPVHELSLRTYYFDADSNLNMIQYEPGTRSRVWMNSGRIRYHDHQIQYDEFTAVLNPTKDTLTIEY